MIYEIIDKCIDCGLCVDDCEFLNLYCKSPKELAENFVKKSYRHEKPEIVYSCNLCGLCKEVCPEELDTGQMCADLSAQLIKEGIAPLPQHQRAINEQDWLTSDSFTVALPAPGSDKCERFFFPGCNIASNSPETVIKAYKYLQSKLPGTGIILGCCGALALDMGDESKYLEIQKNTLSELEKYGASELIVCCPHCYHNFESNMGNLKLTTYYEIMAEHGIPEEAKITTDTTFTIHDSCKTRYESKIHDAVRKIIKELGYTIEEIKYSKELARCCGLGGMTTYIDPKLTNKITMRRAREMPHDVITYCASCRTAFALVRKRSLHILDLVFNPDWEADIKKLPPLGDARQKIQSQLKIRLVDENKS